MMKFEELCNKINNAKDQKEIDEIVVEWKIDNAEMNDWIERILDGLEDFDKEKLPYFLDSLYRQNDKFKFLVFCMILEEYHTKLPFITNLESVPLFKAKYEMLVPTLVKVINNSNNGITDCMYLILLNNDPAGELLKDEEKQEIINGLNEKLVQILDYIYKNDEIEETIYYSLEIILDVATYLNNEETLKIIKEVKTEKLNISSKMFLIKTKKKNNIDIDEKEIVDILEKEEHMYNFLSILERAGDTESIKRCNQESIAKSLMIDWLKYPTELGKAPEEIEKIGKLEIDGISYYIYKFRDSRFAEKGWMIGIAGGFENNKMPTIRNTGNTFSKFEEMREDYENQAKEIIEFINEHWRKRANN